ncbi:MAG: hypothetical protein LBN97_05695 [Oscillospiraceae bacterium]|jgi:virulence-associated protein VagC|nr:hypothetical protein [Oscillospiraceae bacterium]
MTFATVFTSEGKQAVRLPKSIRVDCSELIITRVGSSLMLTPEATAWDEFLNSPELDENFVEIMLHRNDNYTEQTRDFSDVFN